MAHDARDSLDHSHGSAELPLVNVDTYNAELKDGDGFLGDRASNRAFRKILDNLRTQVKATGEEDPLGDESSRHIAKRTLDRALMEGEPLAGGLVLTAIEEFATNLATVTMRLLKTKAWKDTERIVVGGGLRQSRIGELSIGRAAVMVKSAGFEVDLIPIRHLPDHAGLIGTTHLAPAWLFAEHEAMLTVDIGGSNIRAGIVDLRKGHAKSKVHSHELWRHRDESPRPKRGHAVDRLTQMLQRLVDTANKEKLNLMPLVGIGCPGVIESDARIAKGAQNLPGNWESKKFNLAAEIKAALPRINEYETYMVMHNDAVVQGLSEAPFMRDVEKWGVLTIGTGLGNARFTNRPPESVRARAPWSPIR